MLGEGRARLERGFEALGRLVYRWRWLVLILICGMTWGSALRLADIKIDNSSSSYLHDDDPASILYDAFRRQFGQDSMEMVVIEPPEVFDLAFLEKLRRFHEDVEREVPHVAEVTSLLNVRQTRGEGDLLLVEDLLEDWPENEADLVELRSRVLANPLYLDQFISRDERFTTVLIRADIAVFEDVPLEEGDLSAAFDEIEVGEGAPAKRTAATFLSHAEKEDLVRALDAVVARYEGDDFKVQLVGNFVFSTRITEMMRTDVTSYMAVCALVILFLLGLLFRRISGVLLPALVVMVTLIHTFGAMSVMGIPFSVSLQMIPVFLLCVCVCNSVHLLVLIYQNLVSGMEKGEAIAAAFGHSGVAILMTSLTTAAGMASFTTAKLAPIAQLGIVSAVGVGLAFLLSMTLLPALVGVLPIGRKSTARKAEGMGAVPRLLVRAGAFATHRPAWVLSASCLLLVLSAVGIMRLSFAYQPITWFPEDHPVRRSTELVDTQLGGSRTVEVVIDSGRENGLQDPLVLKRMEEATVFAESLREGNLRVGKSVSLIDVVRETHQALNANDPAFYRIPADRQLVAQELLLFENSGSDDLEPLVDSSFQQARISLRIPRTDRMLYAPFLSQLEAGLGDIFGEDVLVELTGSALLFGRIFVAMIDSMARSYALAFALITPLMMLMIGSLRLGLISMVPNLFPVIVVLGVMGWLGLSLDVSTILIGSILIGLAVDDTIHIFHRVSRTFDQVGDVKWAVRETMQTTGVALLLTSLVLATGFLSIGAMGTMTNTIIFGFITALGIVVAFVADVLIAPALMTLVLDSRPVRAASPAAVEEMSSAA